MIKEKKKKRKYNGLLLDIDPTQVEKLAMMHCTNKEIAAFFNCDEKTIYNRFADVVAKGKEKGKSRLRQLQWNSAEKGNVAILIWLGKQYLGQKEPSLFSGDENNELSKLAALFGAQMVQDPGVCRTPSNDTEI